MIQIQFNLTPSAAIENYDTLILPVFSENKTKTFANQIKSQTLIETLAEQGDFAGKVGQTQMLLQTADCARILLVGLGDSSSLSVKTYLEALNSVATILADSPAKRVLNTLTDVYPHSQSTEWALYQNTLAIQRNQYEYAHFSRGEFTKKNHTLIELDYPVSPTKELEMKLVQAQATGLGMSLTQDLANMPSNFCTPSYLAETAESLAQTYGFKADILEREEMIKMGMGAFMAVAQGTSTPPKMICLSYSGGNEGDAPIALVGKGVTFDTGGISLKPGQAMDEMKYDMGGAATVLGVFKALGEIKPKLNVVAIIPATENMPAHNAIKPGDVVTSLSGQTIEILNTDAEGRLILCDALTYAQKTYQPKKVIDMATLTGACIIALGHHMSAVLGNNQLLVDHLLEAGQNTYDRVWQMPLSEEYDEQLKSNFADMANIGGRPAGTITAAQFLARYTKDVDWAHLDIAGTAWVSGSNKGATGRPVPMLVEFLLNQTI